MWILSERMHWVVCANFPLCNAGFVAKVGSLLCKPLSGFETFGQSLDDHGREVADLHLSMSGLSPNETVEN